VLNSVVCKPTQGERIALRDVERGAKYWVQGYAYAGAGLEVQRVEESLDERRTWLFATREFPEYPIRHRNKFGTWLFWSVEVDLADSLRVPGVVVRCTDATKNTQPRESTWNLMRHDEQFLVYREGGDGSGCRGSDPCGAVSTSHRGRRLDWRINGAVGGAQDRTGKARGGNTSQTVYPERDEKHDKEDDCWIVVDDKVYDATSVLAWHSGGKTAILAHARKCHCDTTDEFASFHDDFGYQKTHGGQRLLRSP
jgi:nitrate reductase (NAD(P)H)